MTRALRHLAAGRTDRARKNVAYVLKSVWRDLRYDVGYFIYRLRKR